MVVMKKITKWELYISVFKASEINKACMSKWSFTYFLIISMTLSSDIITIWCCISNKTENYIYI